MANPNPSPATRFEPGRSGNPHGRLPGRTVATQVREIIGSGGTVNEQIADALIWSAVRGNVQAIRLILDRLEGKTPKRIQVSDVSGGYVVAMGRTACGETRRFGDTSG